MVGEHDTGGTGPRPVFPLPQPENDPRFTIGLLLDVRDVLARHGYPMDRATSWDVVELRQALFRFLYASSEAEGDRQ